MTMNQIISIVAAIVGILGAAGYVAHAMGRPTPLLRKLGPMQQRFGKTPGTVVHFTAYVILPLVVATVLYLVDA